MADKGEGDSEIGIRSPRKVHLFDEQPKPCYMKVVLIIPGLTVKKPLFKDKRISNGTIDVKFGERSFKVNIQITSKKKDGKAEHFRYQIFKLRDKIVPEECYHEVDKDQVILILHKAEKKEWNEALSNSLETQIED